VSARTRNGAPPLSSGTYANGTQSDCPPGVTSGCTPIPWPGYRTTAWHVGKKELDIRNWYGGLVDGMRDASGQMYMHNRYYDPATGQFTQTDPIGLAGGLNAYGFADGDPVSYGDPYGLSPYDCCRYDGISVSRIEADARNFEQHGPTCTDAAVAGTITIELAAGPLLGRLSGGLLARVGLGGRGGAVLNRARFAQRWHSERFSAGGRFAGQTVDDVAAHLRSGSLSTSDVPIDYIVRDGNTLILRSVRSAPN
jgi:RHS repeat-associated protein